MNISVLGCGRWGSFIAWYLNKIGKKVTLYGREQSAKTRELIVSRTNSVVTLDEKICITTNLEKAIKNAQIVVISVGSQQLRSLMEQLYGLLESSQVVVLCMKGLETSTAKRLTQVVKEYAPIGMKTAVWVGPGHVQEFVSGVPNCMIIDSEDKNTICFLADCFGSELIRFYYGTDLIGSEIGAASKNVIGIAAGFLDGLSQSSLKGALMARGTHEISVLIKKMGGDAMSAYGLCHLGDYEATVFSKYSHNRRFGEAFIKGEEYELLAEGYYTVKAMVTLSSKYEVDMPICKTVFNILYNNLNPMEAINELFLRSTKSEFIK